MSDHQTQTETPLLLGSSELAARLGVTRHTICRWRLAGWLPKPVRVGTSGVFWLRSTVEAWEQAGRPLTDGRLWRATVQKTEERGEDLGDWLSPQTTEDFPANTGDRDDWSEELRREADEYEQELAAFEQALDSFELLIHSEEVVLPRPERIRFLLDRLGLLARSVDESEDQPTDHDEHTT